MSTDGSYDKGTDSVMYRTQVNQELNTVVNLIFFDNPAVPSGIVPWWVSKPSNTQFLLEPGVYDFGLSVYSRINTVATIFSGTRAIVEFNGVGDNNYRLSLGGIPTTFPVGTQISGFLGGLIEFDVSTIVGIQFNNFTSGNVSLLSSQGTYIKFIRLA